jgi:tetratricopeptide (TPR) repeat protein
LKEISNFDQITIEISIIDLSKRFSNVKQLKLNFMKKMAFILLLCLSFGTIIAQESIKLQNAGNDALKAKDYAGALGNYEKAMAVWGTAPQDFAMIYNCAFCAFQIKDYEKAIKYFDQSIANNFKAEDAMFNKAIVYKVLKNNDEYNKVINEGVVKYPENAKFKGELSRNYYVESVSHVNGANAILKGAVDKINTKKFKDAKDPGYIAEIAKAKKEFGAAIELLDKALALTPADEKISALKATCDKQIKAL